MRMSAGPGPVGARIGYLVAPTVLTYFSGGYA